MSSCLTCVISDIHAAFSCMVGASKWTDICVVVALDPEPVFTESTTILKSLLCHWDGFPLLEASLTPEDWEDIEQIDDSGKKFEFSSQ